MIGFNTFYFKLAALILAGITATLAGMFNTLYKPIVSPEIAGLGFTVEGLLMLLIGGIGTLSGAMIGAAVLRLMEFYFSRWFGASASFVLGAIYVTDRDVSPLRHRGHVAAAPAGHQGRLAALAGALSTEQAHAGRRRPAMTAAPGHAGLRGAAALGGGLSTGGRGAGVGGDCGHNYLAR